MRQLLRYISVLMMLFVGTIASAQSTIQVMTVTNGTVSVDKASATKGELVTITVTPGKGYYFLRENLEVVKTVNPASTRGDVPIAGPIVVSGSDPADLSVARSYTFTVPGDGYVLQVSATFTARTAITDGMVSLSATNFTYNGSDQKPTVSVSGLTEGNDYTVSFAESAWKDVGTYTIYVNGMSTYKGTVTKTFTISAADGSLTPPSGKSGLVYTGVAQDLITAGSSTTGTMQYSLDGTNYSTKIPQGTDAKEYTIYYKVVANAGYSNVDPSSFKVTISPKTVSSPTITLSETSFVYDGNAKEPTATVKDGETTIPASEYTVSYKDNTEVGTATVTITDKDGGNYTVSGSVAFSILSADGSLTPPSAKNNLVYTGAAQDLIEAGSSTTGTMQYSLDGTNYSTEIPQGTDAKEYTIYYKVVANAGYSNVDPSSFKVTISPKKVSSPTITLSETSYVYDGNVKEPTVTVKDGDATIPASEYTVSYSNNTEVGTATVTITDKDGGNYTVSGSVAFSILSADGSLTPPSAKNNLVYTGAAQYLIEAGSSTTGTMQYSLDGTNYSTEIPQGTDAKEYTVYYKVVANAGYSNVDPSSFKVTISPKTVSSPTITLSETSFVYDGNAKEPTATVKDGETTIPASEYTVSYKDNTEVGTATVTITDKDGGNYTVSGSVAFSITAPETPSVVNTDESVTVDGQEFYEPSKEVTEAIKEAIETDIALPQKAEGRVEVTEGGGLKFSKGEDLLVGLLDMKLRDIVKFIFTGRLFGDSSKLRLKNASTHGTRAAGDMELISEAEYEVIEAGDQVVTVKLEEGEATVETIAITESEKTPITIGKSGKASYCGDKSLDFSFSDEVKAYIATGFDKYEGTIWLTRVKDVPAGVPVLIKGEANKTYDVPVTDSQNSYYTNMFVGNTSGEKIQIQETDGDRVNYYLSGDGTFKSVNKSANIGNNKCYLQLPKTFETAVTGETQKVKVGSIGKASFAAPVDLDFTNVDGLKAFTATGYDKSTKTIWLTRVMKVQKGEGVLLKGDAKEYEIPSVAVQSSYMNMFVGNTSGDKIQVQEKSEDGSQTNFYLKGDGTFVSVNGYVNIGNNKCYLELPTSMVAVASTRGAEANYILEEAEIIKLPISFRSLGNDGDGTTGINVQSSMFNVQSDAYYTLQGQRVQNPSKGLYIKNGKKVVIK